MPGFRAVRRACPTGGWHRRARWRAVPAMPAHLAARPGWPTLGARWLLRIACDASGDGEPATRACRPTADRPLFRCIDASMHRRTASGQRKPAL
ncbi:hypothetical protein C7S16_0310 [Burkholderia thailandensis]|uniref:Uncharacterized protein n=1 Tax=Burkholderia thailandensis TaxID=57975 RepID=A0AAW9D4T0_BURTH|nr:hypothetical protein [Burkholderia thailandensis]MDW9256828.1 hypothetical protein [Burkholderia thailandensis]